MGWDLNRMNNSFMKGLVAEDERRRKALTSWADEGYAIFLKLWTYNVIMFIFCDKMTRKIDNE